MSALTQFFGGQGGGAIRVRTLLVTGGSGNGFSCDVTATEGCRATVRSDQAISYEAKLDITPGVTVPITVGYGGTSFAGNCYAISGPGSIPGWTCNEMHKQGSHGGGSCFGDCAYICTCYSYVRGCSCYFPCYGCRSDNAMCDLLAVSKTIKIYDNNIACNGGFYPYNCFPRTNVWLNTTYLQPRVCNYESVKDAFDVHTLNLLNTCISACYPEPSQYSFPYQHERNRCLYPELQPMFNYLSITCPTCPGTKCACVCESYHGYGKMTDILGPTTVFVHSVSSNQGSYVHCNPWPGSTLPTGVVEVWQQPTHPMYSCVGHGNGAKWYISPTGDCNCCGACTADGGTVIVQYADVYGAATTSSPCVFDCSPQTPGCYTYRFICPGSITFP